MTTHFRTNLRDIEFNLFEFAGIGDYLGQPPFADFDPDIVRDVLREVERLSVEDLAASFVEGDRIKLQLEDGEVHLPDVVKKSLDAYYEGGWDRFALPESLGGAAAPPTVRWGATEMIVGANPAIYFYVSGALMAAVIDDLGTEEQREMFAKPMVEGRWGGTMVLTEPDAGSDVGAGTTKAFHVEEAASITSRESSASSPAASTTITRTSSTWCSPAPRAPSPAPRGCRCSSSPSSW
jgi:alkylation response protein AidB-like acyl-CoA dehydrogenase